MNARLPFDMRAPCSCGSERGYIIERGSQDTVRCYSCDKYQYNAPRRETGKPVRSVKTRSGIKPGARYRVLERDGHRCSSCGRGPDEGPLHVDHKYPVEWMKSLGMPDKIIDDERNLRTLCDACNLGKGSRISPECQFIELMAQNIVERLKRRPDAGEGA